MKAQWRTLAARFGALAQRERVLVSVAIVACVIFIFHAVALDSVLARRERLNQQLVETRLNIRSAETMLKMLEARPDPDAVRRSYRDAVRKQLAEMDASMQGLQAGLVPPERMATLLEDMLARNRGLQLVALRTLPVQRLETPGSTPPAAAGGKVPKPPERSIYQHSVEITLQGSYADLYEYLAYLERSPLRMFWGRLNVESAHPRLTATLIVHTLSLSKAWLVV